MGEKHRTSEEFGAGSLVVDLDGTLVQCDLLEEAVLAFVHNHPFQTPKLAWVATRGALALKDFLAQHVKIDPSTLPYNNSVLDLISQARESGCKRIALVSGASAEYVRVVAQHLGCFDEWHGSDSKNLTGKTKLEFILERFGSEARYVGNSVTDVAVWVGLGRALVANSSRAVLKRLALSGVPVQQIGRSSTSLPVALLRAMRPHQWVKNLLLFVPLLAAHRFAVFTPWIQALVAFLAFCLLASCTYVINDLVDLQDDRRHAEKRCRPLASGALHPWQAALFVPVAFMMAGVLGSFLPPMAGAFLGIYFLVSLVYSFALKRVHSLDLVMLAAMYTLRLVIGGLATHTPLTPWILAFSVFFFFGLAAMKRFSDLSATRPENLAARGYRHEDKPPLLVMGLGSSLLSILVFALYINSPQVDGLYSTPTALWMLLPVMLFWNSRVWIAAARGQVRSDPVSYALKSPESYVVGVVVLVCFWMAL